MAAITSGTEDAAKRQTQGAGRGRGMSHQGHEILKCNKCKRVVMQCRCIDENKPIRWTTCESCHRKAITDGFSKPSEETQQ